MKGEHAQNPEGNAAAQPKEVLAAKVHTVAAPTTQL